jgi:hypothetical protein
MKSIRIPPPSPELSELPDTIPALARALPVRAKAACLVIQGYLTADYGTEAMAHDLLGQFGRDCLEALQQGTCDAETTLMIGAWLEQEAWLAHA